MPKKEKNSKKKKSSPKKKKDANNQTLSWVVGITGGIIILILGAYFYTQSQMSFNYNGIDFEAKNYGSSEKPLILYETKTLLVSNDGENALFGFRIYTKPSSLKRVPFENLENFNLMKLNAYSLEEDKTFSCQGEGIISIVNLKRVFEKAGMTLINDPNATCDEQGRYNYFNIVYGDKTEIRNIGLNCYEIVVEGNDEECEILKATEKLLLEIFVKYRDMTGQ